jgi:hypothetical protein
MKIYTKVSNIVFFWFFFLRVIDFSETENGSARLIGMQEKQCFKKSGFMLTFCEKST